MKIRRHQTLRVLVFALAFNVALFAMTLIGNGATRTVAQFATKTPTPTITPTTIPPTVAPTRIATFIPGTFNGDPAVATWTPPPPGENIVDGNFLFGRPLPEPFPTYWARNYSYGADKNQTAIVHHGLDFPAPNGAPIIAAADGVVWFADADSWTSFSFRRNFYGNVVVIEHPFMYADGRKIYTLYGHMSQIFVQKGQAVKAGDVLGLVGSTGVAFGPHLHFEVRIGDPLPYNSGRNPELWIVPYPRSGVVAGRLMDIQGNLLPGWRVELASPGYTSFAFSYANIETINGDNRLHENFVIPDVPEGYHTIFVKSVDGTTLFRDVIHVYRGKVTLSNINIIPRQ